MLEYVAKVRRAYPRTRHEAPDAAVSRPTVKDVRGSEASNPTSAAAVGAPSHDRGSVEMTWFGVLVYRGAGPS
jgi:hypothetical protein